MAIEDITSLRRCWGAIIKYRHIPRGSNQLADWLTNIARVRKQDEDCTEELRNCLPFSPPPRLVVPRQTSTRRATTKALGAIREGVT